MDWRSAFLFRFGPGFLGGVTFGQWVKLLREQRFAISPTCLFRALSISAQSVGNSLLSKQDQKRFGRQIEEAVIPPSIFVLGHWRSGTTHLHNLLTIDERFAFPNNYQVGFPHTFLSTEAGTSRWLSFFFPRQRPMDNIEWDLASPQEDEFALAIACLQSPYMSWVFPRRRERFEKYLTMRGASEAEIAAWKAALLHFLKKLTTKYGRPLVLKSPPHTARIRLLLEMFPDAKFVHIHRNPYDVFQSSRSTFSITDRWNCIQRRPRGAEAERAFDSWVLRQYREMYRAYFEERSRIPKGNHCELAFEDLDKEPLEQIRRVYETLGLPEFTVVEPRLKAYVASIAGYRKNVFPALPEEIASRIAREWRVCFDEWGYEASR